MGSLLFLVLHALGKCQSFYDSDLFCLVLALDTSSLLRWWMWQKSGR